MSTSRTFSAREEEILDYALYTSCGLSMLGTLFIIMTFLIFPRTRTYGTRLIFFLSISDFFTSFCWFPWALNHFDVCVLQASLLHFFQTASYLWSLSIAVSLFQVFFLERQDEPNKVMILYHLFNWGYPLVTMSTCLIIGRFGSVGKWCWIKDPHDWLRFTVYGPAVLILIFILINYIAIRVKMQGLESDFKRGLLRKLSLYLIAFVASQLPAVINFFQNFMQPNEPIFVLFLLQAACQPAQGLFNCLVYGFNEDAFVDQYRTLTDKFKFNKKCHRICCLCAPKKEKGKSPMTEEEVPIFDYDYHSGEEEPSVTIK